MSLITAAAGVISPYIRQISFTLQHDTSLSSPSTSMSFTSDSKETFLSKDTTRNYITRQINKSKNQMKRVISVMSTCMVDLSWKTLFIMFLRNNKKVSYLLNLHQETLWNDADTFLNMRLPLHAVLWRYTWRICDVCRPDVRGSVKQ